MVLVVDGSLGSETYAAAQAGTFMSLGLRDTYLELQYTGFEESVARLVGNTLPALLLCAQSGINHLSGAHDDAVEAHLEMLGSVYATNDAPLRDALDDLLRKDGYSVGTKLEHVDSASRAML